MTTSAMRGSVDPRKYMDRSMARPIRSIVSGPPGREFHWNATGEMRLFARIDLLALRQVLLAWLDKVDKHF